MCRITPRCRGRAEVARLTRCSLAAWPPRRSSSRSETRVVRVSNPDKVYFPGSGHTKLDLVRYYLSVEEGIVRALYERPTQLRRFPGGVDGEAIYQKRVPEKRPDWIETARVTFPSGRHADELCVTEVAQVAWAANLGTVDFHPWPSRRRDTEHPDELRIDIDPQPGNDLHARQARRGGRARDARRDRLHGLAEDIGQPRHPHRVPHRAALGVPGRPPRRARLRARDRAPAAEARHDRLVEGGARQARLHRLQPERARPHDRVRLLGAGAPRRHRVGAGDVGRAARCRDRGLHARDDACPLREARRRPGRDRRRRLRPARPARVGRARRAARASPRRRTRRTSPRCPASRRACSRRVPGRRESM